MKLSGNMRSKQTIAVLAIAIISIAAIGAGILLLNNNSDADGDIIVEDSRGRTVVINNEIKSIFCENSCSLELVSYFNAVEKVIAIDSKDALNGKKTYTVAHRTFFEDLPIINTSNAENIIQLNPSIIISSTVAVSDLDHKQQTYGIPVFAINADLEFGNEKWFTQIISLGKLLGEEDRANEISDGVNSLVADITSNKADEKTGYTCGMMFYGQGTFLKTSGDWLPFTYSGVSNVMPQSTAGVGNQPYNTSIDQVLARNFDYIFIDNSNLASVKSEINNYRIETTLNDKSAIINDNVYSVLTYKMWGTQWDNVLINCFYVADVVNGSVYSWSFEEKANEVLTLFYGNGTISYDDVVVAQGGCEKVTL